jgi:hypothetical protein
MTPDNSPTGLHTSGRSSTYFLVIMRAAAAATARMITAEN